MFLLGWSLRMSKTLKALVAHTGHWCKAEPLENTIWNTIADVPKVHFSCRGSDATTVSGGFCVCSCHHIRQLDAETKTYEAKKELQAALADRCDAVTDIDCARFENFELKDFCGAHQVFDSQGIERWGKFPEQPAGEAVCEETK